MPSSDRRNLALGAIWLALLVGVHAVPLAVVGALRMWQWVTR